MMNAEAINSAQYFVRLAIHLTIGTANKTPNSNQDIHP